MHRIFGKKKPTKPEPTLDDASKSVETRGGEIDERIKKMDAELRQYKAQMSKMKAGSAPRKQIEQRALRVLKQKKLYEKQRDSLYNQQFNIDQTKFAQQNVKDTVTTVAAMKSASKELKVSMKEVDIDDIEDLHDDMNEMLEMNDEIQDVLGRSYNTPEVDETDLTDELNALEDELEQEAESEEVPAYIAKAAAPKQNVQVAEPAVAAPVREEEVDEFGLPKLAARKLEAS